jgi:hypothetical protein
MSDIFAIAMNESTKEVDERRKALVNKVQDLHTQLGDKDRRDQRGQRLSPKGYFSWKKSVQEELNASLRDLREINTQLKELKPPSSMSLVNLDDVITTMKALIAIVEDFEEEDLSPVEAATLQMSKNFLAKLCESHS